MKQKEESPKEKVRFSEWSENYREQVNRSVSFLGQDIDFFTQAKVRHLMEIVHNRWGNTQNLRVLDLGCGVGTTDSLLNHQFGKLVGLDLEEEFITKAKSNNPWVKYQVYDGQKIPFQDESFDLVFSICVLHHVPPAQWDAFCKEMARVTKRGGLSVIFEHNPWNPLTRKVVRDCPFDRDAVLLPCSKTTELLKAARLEVQSQYILFFPFFSKSTAWIEKKLRHFPLGAQYFVSGSKL